MSKHLHDRKKSFYSEEIQIRTATGESHRLADGTDRERAEVIYPSQYEAFLEAQGNSAEFEKFKSVHLLT